MKIASRAVSQLDGKQYLDIFFLPVGGQMSGKRSHRLGIGGNPVGCFGADSGQACNANLPAIRCRVVNAAQDRIIVGQLVIGRGKVNRP